MQNLQYFQMGYFVLLVAFFVYVGGLQKKVRKLQSEIDQLKNNSAETSHNL